MIDLPDEAAWMQRPSLVYYAHFLPLAKASQEQLQRLQRPKVRGLQVVEVLSKILARLTCHLVRTFLSRTYGILIEN